MLQKSQMLQNVKSVTKVSNVVINCYKMKQKCHMLQGITYIVLQKCKMLLQSVTRCYKNVKCC